MAVPSLNAGERERISPGACSAPEPTGPAFDLGPHVKQAIGLRWQPCAPTTGFPRIGGARSHMLPPVQSSRAPHQRGAGCSDNGPRKSSGSKEASPWVSAHMARVHRSKCAGLLRMSGSPAEETVRTSWSLRRGAGLRFSRAIACNPYSSRAKSRDYSRARRWWASILISLQPTGRCVPTMELGRPIAPVIKIVFDDCRFETRRSICLGP